MTMTNPEPVADAVVNDIAPERFRRVLWRAVALPLILMVGLAAVLLWQTASLLSAARRVEHTERVIANAHRAERLVVALQAGYRGHLLTGRDEYLDPYRDGLAHVDAEFARLRRLVSDNAPQAGRVDRLAGLVGEYKSFAADRLARFAAGAPAVALVADDEDRRVVNAVREGFAAFVATEERLRDERAAASRRAAALSVGVSVGVSLLTGGLLAWFFRGQLAALDATYRRALGDAEARTAEVRVLNQTLEDRVAERTAALAKEREFLAALLASLREGIVACDGDGRLTLFNRATREFHGLPEGPVPPERWAEHYSLYRPDGRTPMPREEVPLFRALRGESVHNAEMVIAPVGGPARSLLANGQAIVDADGRHVGAVVSMRDVTELKRSERAREAAVAELRRSNRELQDFASVASHDLQEPLRKVQAFGDRLKARFGDLLPADGQDYLQRMQAAARRMSTLIEDLLTFSRVTSRARPFEPVDLAAVIADVTDDLEHRIEREAGRVEADDVLPTVDGDRTQLRQLFQNLVGNGLKFHPPDRPPVVTVRARPADGDDGSVTIEVRDNGIGFDEKYLDRIFNIFQRLHGRDEFEGTGIGLAVCRKIVERHGGRITATSRPGEGAAFAVTLPRRQLTAQAIVRTDEAEAA